MANDVKQCVHVSLIAFRDGDKILLNRRADTGGTMWEFIGGGIEAGETPHEAIRREIAEEVIIHCLRMIVCSLLMNYVSHMVTCKRLFIVSLRSYQGLISFRTVTRCLCVTSHCLAVTKRLNWNYCR